MGGLGDTIMLAYSGGNYRVELCGRNNFQYACAGGLYQNERPAHPGADRALSFTNKKLQPHLPPPNPIIQAVTSAPHPSNLSAHCQGPSLLS